MNEFDIGNRINRVQEFELQILELQEKIDAIHIDFVERYGIPIGTAVQLKVTGNLYHIFDILIINPSFDLRYNLRKAKKDGTPSKRGNVIQNVSSKTFDVVEQ